MSERISLQKSTDAFLFLDCISEGLSATLNTGSSKFSVLYKRVRASCFFAARCVGRVTSLFVDVENSRGRRADSFRDLCTSCLGRRVHLCIPRTSQRQRARRNNNNNNNLCGRGSALPGALSPHNLSADHVLVVPNDDLWFPFSIPSYPTILTLCRVCRFPGRRRPHGCLVHRHASSQVRYITLRPASQVRRRADAADR